MTLASKITKKRVAIVGARGYSGLELARILLQHPKVELTACFAHDNAFALTDYLPESAAALVPVLPLQHLEAVQSELDCIFLATPTEASLQLVPQLYARSSASIIDLSGAFRLQKGSQEECLARFATWYKVKHSEPELLTEATYGLVPFAQPKGGGKQLVANPGCYATAILMALVPLLKNKVIEKKSIVIDAKSGTSGAGRKALESQLFTEVDGECLPYRVGQHQHLPEICEWAEEFSQTAIDPHFTTHLLPVRRGIVASLYLELSADKSAKDVAAAFASAFENYPLARVTALDSKVPQPLSPNLSLSLKRVVGSARVHISYQVIGKKLYVFSLIDNLLKGAASQAVENFNRISDFPLALALEHMEGTL